MKVSMHTPQEKFMEAAFEEAADCMSSGDKPVGAVIAREDEILSKSGNRTYRDTNALHHAEIVAIDAASKELGKKHLSDCVLYTTHEPCPMCAGAAVYSHIGGVVFGTTIEDADRFVDSNPGQIWRSIRIPLSTIVQLGDQDIFVVGGFMRDKCRSLFDMLLERPDRMQGKGFSV